MSARNDGALATAARSTAGTREPPVRRRAGRGVRLAALTCLLLASITAAACGSRAGSTPSPTPTSTVRATSLAVPTRAVPTALPALPRTGGTIRFAVKEAPPHMDPHRTVSPALSAWGPGIAYSRLFRFATGPGIEAPGNEVICDLCESWEQPDALTVRAFLRAGVRWHPVAPVGGRLLTADDVAFSFERLGGEGSPHAALFSNVASVRAADDRTVEFRLREPDAEALEKLADGRARIVSRRVVEAVGDLLRGPTAGTGPWVVASFSVEAAVYEANGQYYEPGIPYLDRFEVQVVPDAETRIVAVRNKLLDFAQEDAADVQEALAAVSGLSAFSQVEPGTGVEVAFNTARLPLSTVETRRTLMAQWDPGGVTASRWGGEAEVTAGFPGIPPSWLLDQAEVLKEIAARGEAQSGSALPASIKITVGDFGDSYIAVAADVASAWASLGIAVDVEKVPTRVYGDLVWSRGEFDVMVGSPPPSAGLTDYLRAVHHSQGTFNKTGFSTSEIDRIIEAQAVEFDNTRRRDLVMELQRLTLAGSHRYMPVTRRLMWVHNDRIAGLWPNLFRSETHWLTQIRLAGPQ